MSRCLVHSLICRPRSAETFREVEPTTCLLLPTSLRSALLGESGVEPPSGITHRTVRRSRPAGAAVIDAQSSWPRAHLHLQEREREWSEGGVGDVGIKRRAEPERRRQSEKKVQSLSALLERDEIRRAG